MAYIDTGAYNRWRKAQEVQRMTDEYNAKVAETDKKYENKGLGGFLGDIVGGIGKTIGDVGKGVGGLLGTAGASAADIVNSIKDGKVTTDSTNAFKRYWYDAENDKDAAAKAAGTSLNAATTLASTVLPGVGAGTAAGKLAAGTAANTAAGALGGIADELQQQGKDASLEGAANRALSGAAAGLATGGLNRKIGNATSNIGSKLLNNKLATSAIGRGALSGAVGGSVGAGTSAALAGQDAASAALQGGLTGAMGGATQAGIISGANKLGQAVRNRIGGNRQTNNMVATDTAVEVPKRQNTNEPFGAYGDSQLAKRTKGNQAAVDNSTELATSTAGQLRKKSAEKLLDQYGTIDKPMARSARALDSVQKVADAGFEKPADVEKIISEITGDSGKVTKLTRQLVSTAKPVNTFEGLDELIDNRIAMSGLQETEANAVRNILEAQINSLPSRREGSISYVDNAEDVFDVVKNLEKRSANFKGKSGNNYQNTTPERTDKAAILDAVANVLKDRIYENAAPMSQILTNEVRQDLIRKSPNNKKWANYVDNVIMKSQNIGELRNSVAPFVNMGKVIENQYMNYGTYGQRVGDSAKEAGKFAKAMFKVPVAGQIAEGIANSNVAKRTMAKGYAMAADIAASQPNVVEAEVVPRQTQTQIQTQPRTQMNTQNASNMQNILGNYIGRTTGVQQAGNNLLNLERERDYNNLDEMFYDIQNYINNSGGNQGTAMGLDGSYGMVGGTGSQNAATSQLTSQLADIQNGMDLALAAGDIKSYQQLLGLYSDLYSLYQTQNKASSSNNMTTSEKNQLAKLQSAGSAIDELESLYQKAGGGQGIIGGNIANFLGGLGLNSDVDAYNQLSQGLINQIGAAIGKTDALNTDGEVQRALSLVPKITDTKETAAAKLASLRSLLQTNTGTYNDLYNA